MTTSNPTLQTAIDTYIDYLRAMRRLSENTCTSYCNDLAQLQSFSKKDITQLSAQEIRNFVAKLHATGLSARSIARKLSAWRNFYQWLVESNQLSTNPAEDIRPPKQSKPLPKTLTVDDAVALVSKNNAEKEPDSPDITACNAAMFELLYSSGLRVSELTSLDVTPMHNSQYQSVSWLDEAEKLVHVMGKGSKIRTVPVGEPALEAIQKWLPFREALVAKTTNESDKYALFVNTRGKRMSIRMVQLRLNAHALAIGMPVHVHPHMLRHSFASHVLQSSSDLRAVQEMLGHTSIKATQIYTALDFQHLAEVYDKAHPHAKGQKK